MQIAAGSIQSVGAKTLMRARQGSYAYDDHGNTTSAVSHTDGGVTTTRTATFENWEGARLLGLPDRVSYVSYDEDDDPLAPPRVVDHDHDPLGRPKRVTTAPDHPGTAHWAQAEVWYDARGLVWVDRGRAPGSGGTFPGSGGALPDPEVCATGLELRSPSREADFPARKLRPRPGS